jgi:competence protein CoiA
MLTAKRHPNLPEVLARDAQKSEAPFTCPKCLTEVVLHKGNIKVHHFQHKPPVYCSRGEGESEQHRVAKLAIYDALQKEPNVTDLELEKDFGTSVADVFACISNVRVALEIQRSNLSANEISRRTETTAA